MTVGKDVSALFPDVVNCMQTDNLELKKLVYLYLMNYAKSQPDMAIMAVNTFVKVRMPSAFMEHQLHSISISTHISLSRPKSFYFLWILIKFNTYSYEMEAILRTNAIFFFRIVCDKENNNFSI